MIKALIVCLVLMMQVIPTFAQESTKPAFERMFFSLPYKTLEKGVLDTARKHKIYSGIIANLTTPYYDIVGALPIEDQRELLSIIPGTDGQMDKRVIAEFVLSKFAQNSKRYTAMITMWGGKKSSLNKIATFGK